jgi:hypothetical protein
MSGALAPRVWQWGLLMGYVPGKEQGRPMKQGER